MGTLLSLRQVPQTAGSIIRACGLTDEEIVEQLDRRLAAPMLGPVLIGLWRRGQVAEPSAPILRLLAQLRPRATLPPKARPRAS